MANARHSHVASAAHTLPLANLGTTFSPLVAALIAAVSFIIFTDTQNKGLDDAYITYRYAENLARGELFVFNSGDASTFGTSTPLYTLILALGALLGFSIPDFSILLGAVSVALSGAFMTLIASRFNLLGGGIAAVLTWSVSPFLWSHTEGMETPFYIALIFAALWASLCNYRTAAILLGSLCVLTRVDGIAVLAIVAISLWIQDNRSPAKGWGLMPSTRLALSAIPGGLILSGGIIAEVIVFGTPLPNSGLAKLAHGAFGLSGKFSLGNDHFIVQAMTFAFLCGLTARWVGWIWFVLSMLLGGLIAIRRGALFAVVPLWYVAYFVGYLALRLPDFPWYYAPIAAGSILFVWMGIHLVATDVWRRIRPKSGGRIDLYSGASVVAVAVLLVLPALRFAPEWREHRAQIRTPHRLAGEWLARNAVPGETVVAYETGQLAFLSKLRVIDLLGLTEPIGVREVELGNLSWALRHRPTYVFTWEDHGGGIQHAIHKDPEFAFNYYPVGRFAYVPGTEYVLHRRRGTEPVAVTGGAWDGSLRDLHAPSPMTVGQGWAVSITVQNQSNRIWRSNGQNPIRVANRWLDETGQIVQEGLRTDLPFPLAPGESMVVSALVLPPRAPGGYFLQWDLVEEGVAWFTERGLKSPQLRVVVR